MAVALAAAWAGAALASDAIEPQGGSRLSTGYALAAGLGRAAAQGAFGFSALDTRATQLGVDRLFGAADAQLRLIGPGGLFAADPLAAFHLRRPAGAGREWSIGSGGLAGQFFGLAGTPFAGGTFAAPDALQSPYLGLVPHHRHAAASLTFVDGTRLKFGVMSGAEPPALPGLPSEHNAARLGLVEYEVPLAAGKLALSLGELDEDNRILGSEGRRALSLSGGTATRFAEAALAWRTGARSWLAGRLAAGASEGYVGGGLIDRISPALSYAWSLGLLREHAWIAGDRLGFSLSQPMKLARGRLSTPGVPGAVASQYSLRPAVTETDLELNYTRPLGRVSGISYTLLQRFNPGHEAGQESILGLRWQAGF